MDTLLARSSTLLQQLRAANRLPLVATIFVFLLAGFSTLTYANTDPYLSLLVSQAILQHGEIKLDPYKDTVTPPLDSYGDEAMIYRDGEHYYYYPPIGPSLFMLPAVVAVNVVGLDMGLREDNNDVQRALSALMTALIFWLVYQIAACYAPQKQAVLLALVLMLGSSLASVTGTAVWNSSFAAIFVCGSLALLARQRTGRSQTLHPVWLGCLLFAAFISRPTTAIFIALVLLYLLIWQRQAFLKTALAAGILLALFLLANWLEYGQVLPPYFDVGGRVRAASNQTPFTLALYGHTFSPSRGLFIFSPLFLLVLLLAGRYVRRLARRPLFWLGLVWFILHLLASSRTTRWWGGHSFGPRVLTDAVPALVLISLILWRDVEPLLKGRWRHLILGACALLGGFGIFVHVGQGLYNQSTAMWNGIMQPNIDQHQAYLLDWRYPQFLATNSAICDRNRDFMTSNLPQDQRRLVPLAMNEAITYLSPDTQAIFAGWHSPQPGFSWSLCPQAAIFFKLDAVDAGMPLNLSLTAGAWRTQRVTIWLNGNQVGQEQFVDGPDMGVPPRTVLLSVDPAWLVDGGLNEIVFDIPDARLFWSEPHRYMDQRRLGLQFVSLHFEAAE
jgi:hypothetical protein